MHAPLLAIIVALAYGPLLTEYAANLWSRPYYQHFPYYLATCLLLANRALQFPRSDKTPTRATYAPLLAAAACAILPLAYWLASPLLAAVSFLLLLGWWLNRLATELGSPFPTAEWLLFWLLIPPPINLDRQLMESLQRWSSSLSSAVLDTLGVNHLMQGNALLLSGKELFVDEACSGIVSVVSIVSCAALYGVWRYRGPAHTMLLMASAAGWAALLNVVRITTIAVAYQSWGADWTEGLSHTILGLVVFLLALGAVLLTDWALNALLTSVSDRYAEQNDTRLRRGAKLVAIWDRVATNTRVRLRESEASVSAIATAFRAPLLLVAALSLLSAGQLLSAGSPTSTSPTPPRVDDAAFSQALQQDVLPLEIEGLQLTGVNYEERSRDDAFGNHSVYFDYQSDRGETYRVSCDFSYTGGWHELSICYRGIGCELVEREVQTLDQAGDAETAPVEYATLDLRQEDGSLLWVAFCACGFDGAPAEAEQTDLIGRLTNRTTRQHNDALGASFQVQVIVQREDRVSAHDRYIGTLLLADARSRFVEVARRMSQEQE
ncbi:Transmembrane exosortase [Posidoniimonas polymericola]|uniref:Transmembrane exosortase n=1 Tax=Posidoniimonas polymericola TaxID=2528002 RepID=A0A5C5YEK2_9BACT|nr:exosortase U [Posidoniimonas polymericola]TWT73770.1 Transmembrane exosortase [Posidoniimonas polymericola]